jgi:hypothetical protein
VYVEGGGCGGGGGGKGGKLPTGARLQRLFIFTVVGERVQCSCVDLYLQ